MGSNLDETIEELHKISSSPRWSHDTVINAAHLLTVLKEFDEENQEFTCDLGARGVFMETGELTGFLSCEGPILDKNGELTTIKQVYQHIEIVHGYMCLIFYTSLYERVTKPDVHNECIITIAEYDADKLFRLVIEFLNSGVALDFMLPYPDKEKMVAEIKKHIAPALNVPRSD